MPCPSKCPKMFWDSPVFFGPEKNCIIFGAAEKKRYASTKTEFNGHLLLVWNKILRINAICESILGLEKKFRTPKVLWDL